MVRLGCLISSMAACLGRPYGSALLDTALATSTTHVRITPNTITPCPQVANQSSYTCAYVAFSACGATGATTLPTVFDRRFPDLPMVQQGSMSVEHEISAAGSATYLVNLDRQLPNSVDINAFAPFDDDEDASSSSVEPEQRAFAMARHLPFAFYTQQVKRSIRASDRCCIERRFGSYNALVINRLRRARRVLSSVRRAGRGRRPSMMGRTRTRRREQTGSSIR